MASAFSHAAVALSLGLAFRPPAAPARYWILGMACAILPDFDSVGFALGIPYGDLLGHRGLSHSLLFAALSGWAVARLGFRAPEWAPWRGRLILFFFLATASHGLLDALTNGGLGVAFFSPFDPTRYFLPFRPIQVSPISISRFFEGAGLRVMASEAVWVGIPAALFAACAWGFRFALPGARAPVPEKPFSS